MDRRNEANLDRILDEALAGYAQATPAAGLDQRVMNRIQGVHAGRRGWAAALLGIAAVLMLVAGYFQLPLRSVKTKPVNTAPMVSAARAVMPAGPPAPRSRRLAGHKSTRSSRVLPKQQHFPTFVPLTRDERILQALAAQHPNALMASGPIQPLEIQPIQIAPLQSDGAQ